MLTKIAEAMQRSWYFVRELTVKLSVLTLSMLAATMQYHYYPAGSATAAAGYPKSTRTAVPYMPINSVEQLPSPTTFLPATTPLHSPVSLYTTR